MQVNELEAILLEDVVHLLFLVGGEVEVFCDLGIVPPAAHAFAAHPAAFKGALHRRAI